MMNPRQITSPVTIDLVVAFCDLTKFGRFARSLSAEQGFTFMSEYYEFAGDVVEQSGGLVVKFMGDAMLVTYPDDNVDRAILGLKELKDAGDDWIKSKGAPCKHVIKAHFGPVICGQVGTRGDKRLDVFGQTVMTAAVLPSQGFAITPQVFRKLRQETRKLFKKHTPPITYIPVDARHND